LGHHLPFLVSPYELLSPPQLNLFDSTIQMTLSNTKPAIFNKYVSINVNSYLFGPQFFHKQGHELNEGESDYK